MLAKLRSFLLGGLCLLPAAALHAATLKVGPGQPYTTIQSAIDAAAPGDTVLVAPGTYYENIDFKGKAITVTSSAGPATTIIDGSQKAPVVVFINSETRSSILSNFTLTNGQGIYTGPIGGVYVSNSSPTILNNIITSNQCYGIDVHSTSSPLIQGNHISFTHAAAQGDCGVASGAGIWYIAGPATEAVAGQYPVILGNIIEQNTESGLEDAGGNGGAGIALWGGFSVVESNIIRNNATGKGVPPANGGGVGGGMYLQLANGVLFDNLIYGNSSNQDGGGVLSDGPGDENGHLIIVNNTIVDNVVSPSPDSSQSLIPAEQISVVAPGNNVFFYNNVISGSSTNPSLVCYGDPSNPTTFASNDLYNASGPTTGGATDPGTCTFPAGTSGNISLNPQFASPATQDYHLTLASPGVDTGLNSALTFAASQGATVTLDLDGKPRVQDATKKGSAVVDMGAYEFPGVLDGSFVAETLQSSINPSYAGTSVTFSAQLSAFTGMPTGTVLFSDGTVELSVQPISSAGLSTFTTNALSIGTHTIVAAYQPTGSFSPASASLAQVVTGSPTSTTLTCSPNPISLLATSLLSATVTSANGTPTGSITFADNVAALSQTALAGGSATFTYTGRTTGTHTLSATFNPTGTFGGSSATCSEIVQGLPSSASLSAAPASATVGSPITLTADVAPANPPGVGAPTGSVTFLSSGVEIGSATLARGIASITVTTLPAGTDSVSCTYSGDKSYNSSTCNPVSVTITAAPTTLTLTSSANPSPAFTATTFTAHLSSNSRPVTDASVILTGASQTPVTLVTNANGVATYVASTLTPGTYSLSVSFAASPNLLASSATLIETVTRAPTAISVTCSPNPGTSAKTISCPAVLSSLSGAPFTLSVTFFDGSAPVATLALASKRATFTTSQLAAGTHAISASYAGDTNTLPSVSSAVQEVIVKSDFALASSPASLTLRTGHHVTFTVTATSIGAFAGNLELSYAPLPPHATLRITDNVMSITQGSQSATSLYLDTDDVIGYLSNNRTPQPSAARSPGLLAATVLPCLLLLFSRRRRLSIPGLLALVFAAAFLVSASGCSGKYPASTAPGNYSIQITATAPELKTTHTLTIPFTVTE